MSPAIVILGDRDTTALEDEVWLHYPDADILVQSGTVPETLARGVATHRPWIVVLDGARPEVVGDIPAALGAARRADVAVGKAIGCWKRDVLAATLTSRTRFAHLRLLLRRAGRLGASVTSF
jgi:hypothetical protein